MKPLSLASLVVAVFAVGFFVGRFSVADATPPAGALPSGHPPAGAAPMAQAADDGTLRGVVAEIIQVPNYTYLRLTTASGEVWAAVPTTSALSVGQGVAISASTQMTDFVSKSLGRTFASIWFGELAGAAGAAPRADGLPPGHPPMGASPAAEAVAAVKRAEGALALRVADVFTERQLLAGRAVRVKGTVTRVTSINGKHYAHLSDGSGSRDAKDDDLTVIFSAEVKANEQVTAEGTVVLDKDVGIGAVYPVVLDAAQLVGR
jgi:hypothetical protein